MPPRKKRESAESGTAAATPVDVPEQATAGQGAKQRGRQIAEKRTYYDAPDGTRTLVAAVGQPLPDWYVQAQQKSGGKRNVEPASGPEETA